MTYTTNLAGFYNKEYIQNQETVDIGGGNQAKRVVLYDTNGNAISSGAATTVGDGRLTVTTAGTAVQFAAQACKYVIIVGLPGNTNAVVVGASTVVSATASRRGVVLYAEQSQRFDVTNMNLLYLDSITNGEGVAFAWFN